MGRPPATHCAHGHEYTPENTYMRPNGKKECKTCRQRKGSATSAQRTAERAEVLNRSASLVEGTGVKATDAEVETALITLAKHSGVLRRAAEETGRDPGTLDRWRRIFHDRYLEIVEEIAPKIRAKVVEQQMALAERVTEAETRALTLTEQAIEKMDARDIPGALRNLSTTKGIALTHANNFSVTAAPPRDDSDINAIIEGLKRLGVAKVVENEEPVQDAEVVEESVTAAPE